MKSLLAFKPEVVTIIENSNKRLFTGRFFVILSSVVLEVFGVSKLIRQEVGGVVMSKRSDSILVIFV